MESMHPMKKTPTILPSLAMSIALALVAPIVLLSACASGDTPPAPVVERTIQKPGKARLEVTDIDGGAKVVVDLAQTLVVDLPLLPTEGREWSLVDMKPGVLTLTSSKFERDNRDRDGVESPGEMIFQLKPEATGEVVLNFSLRRPHTLEPATKIITYAVTVR
jgi:predicted secreted protein